jgi:hypothetical protein
MLIRHAARGICRRAGASGLRTSLGGEGGDCGALGDGGGDLGLNASLSPFIVSGWLTCITTSESTITVNMTVITSLSGVKIPQYSGRSGGSRPAANCVLVTRTWRCHERRAT